MMAVLVCVNTYFYRIVKALNMCRMKNKLILILIFALFASITIGSFLKDGEVSINLSTGTVDKGRFVPSNGSEPRRTATIRIQESYITWKKYIDGSLRNKIHIDAALPSLQANEEYQRRAAGSDSEKHRQWVKISLGLYGFSNQFCDRPCSRREHNQKVLSYYINQYEREVADHQASGLIKRISDSSSNSTSGGEFYIPRFEHDINSIECHRQSGKYRWCNVSSYLNDNMYLNYQIEYIHLSDWLKIDQNVRALANKVLVNHEML